MDGLRHRLGVRATGNRCGAADAEPGVCAVEPRGLRRRGTIHAGPARSGGVFAFLLCGALVAASGCGAGVDDASLSPLHHTFPSPEALSEAVLTALADGDADTLASLALSELEFRTAVWPDLPSSRPERGVPFDYAWGDLHQKSDNALRRLLARHRGRRYELVRVAFEGGTTPYRTYRVHRETVLDLRDEDGEGLTMALFGSMLEREGEFKLFSYVVD